MGKPVKSIKEALQSAKALRAEIDIEEPEMDEGGGAAERPKLTVTTSQQDAKLLASPPVAAAEKVPNDVLSKWVRHTVGLKHRTKLRLQDAVDGQKKKARYGELSDEEPSNEQEIVERGVNLALAELGYLEVQSNDK